MKKEIFKELVEIVGKDNVTTENADKITHSYDATQKKYLPDAVVYARTVEEVSKVVKVANKWTIPLLPRGAGSKVPIVNFGHASDSINHGGLTVKAVNILELLAQALKPSKQYCRSSFEIRHREINTIP